MRFKAFNARYRLLAQFGKARCSEERVIDDCRLILQCIEQKIDLKQNNDVSMCWAFGKKHIFYRLVQTANYSTWKWNLEKKNYTYSNHLQRRYPSASGVVEKQNSIPSRGNYSIHVERLAREKKMASIEMHFTITPTRIRNRYNGFQMSNYTYYSIFT